MSGPLLGVKLFPFERAEVVREERIQANTDHFYTVQLLDIVSGSGDRSQVVVWHDPFTKETSSILIILRMKAMSVFENMCEEVQHLNRDRRRKMPRMERLIDKANEAQGETE